MKNNAMILLPSNQSFDYETKKYALNSGRCILFACIYRADRL